MDVAITRYDFKNQLPDDEKDAFENIYPVNKYPDNEKIVMCFEQWNKVKLDYMQRMEEYYGFIEMSSNRPTSTDYDKPFIDHVDTIKNCPQILHPLQIDDDAARGPVLNELLETAVKNKSDIEIMEVMTLADLEATLMSRYHCTGESTEIDIDKLAKDLTSDKTFYKIENSLYSEISDFKHMNKLLLKP